MWSVVLYIVAGFLGLLLFLILLLLLAPFYLDARISRVNSCSDGSVSLWWIHPFVLSAVYNFRGNDFALKIAWWKIRKKVDNSEVSEESSLSEAQPDSIGAESEGISETDAAQKAGSETTEKIEIQETKPEIVEKKPGKMDNLIDRVKKSRVIFFLKNQKWRVKMFSWLIRVLGTFRRLVRFDYLNATIKAGLEDPAMLGKMYGYYQAVSKGLQLQNSKVNLSFEPIFMQNHFEGEGDVRICSSVGNLLAPLGVAVFTFPYISTFLLWLSFKRKMKQK